MTWTLYILAGHNVSCWTELNGRNCRCCEMPSGTCVRDDPFSPIHRSIDLQHFHLLQPEIITTLMLSVCPPFSVILSTERNRARVFQIASNSIGVISCHADKPAKCIFLPESFLLQQYVNHVSKIASSHCNRKRLVSFEVGDWWLM